MADLSKEASREAVLTEYGILDLLEKLEAGIKVQTSAIREKRIDHLMALLHDLYNAPVPDDEVMLQDVRSEYQDLLALTEWQQEAARIEWTDQYAEVVEALSVIAEGSLPRPYTVESVLVPAIRRHWIRSGGKKPLPLEVHRVYALCLITWIDDLLGREAPRIQKISQLGVLNTDDVPNLIHGLQGLLWHHPRVTGCEKAAVASYRRRLQLTAAARRVEEDANPGIVRTIWEIVGYESYSEFAFDVGLVLATGGAGAAVKWGKIVAKGSRYAKRISKTKRSANIADEYRDGLKRVKRSQENIRRRLQGSAGRLQRYHHKISFEFYEFAISATKGDQAKTELQAALTFAWDSFTRIGDAAASEQQLRALESKGLIEHKGTNFADITIEGVAEAATELGVNSINNLGSRIKEAQDSCFKTKMGNKKRLYVRWLYLLVTRQILIRLLILVASKRGADPTHPEIVNIVVKSVTAALVETLFEWKVPKNIIQSTVERFVKTTEQALSTWVGRVVSEVVRSKLQLRSNQ